MLLRLIQSIFFLSICSSLQAMKTQQDNTKTAQNYRSIMLPLPSNLKFIRSKIRANHIKELHDTHQYQQVINSYEKTKDYRPDDLSILRQETQKAYRSMQKYYDSAQNIIKKNNRIDALIEEQKNHELALIGDKNAQTLITEQYINKLNPIINAPELIETFKFQNCLYAYELLDFTTTLNEKNIPYVLTDSHDRRLVEIRNNLSIINPSAAYIIQSMRYLQPFTKYKKESCYNNLSSMIPETPETEIICKFLINYGDDTLLPQDAIKIFIATINDYENSTRHITQTISNCNNSMLSLQDIEEQLQQTVKNQKKSSDIITAIANTPLCSKVIQKLSSTTFNRNDPFAPEIHYVLAELYYANKNYAQADSYYKKSTFKLIKEKNARLKAFQACIRGSQIFDAQDITYLFHLADNVYSQLQDMIEADIISLSTIITQWSNVTLKSDSPFIHDFNYILAELCYKDNNHTQADSFYKKNKVAFLKDKKVQLHAFNTRIAITQCFSKQDINYLSSLVGNIYKQLKKINTTDSALSYRVGLLIHALINNNPKMDILEKTNMLCDALHHLTYAHKDGTLNAIEQNKATTACIELHILLSTIYKHKNDHATALKHTKQALQYRAHNNPSTQEHAIATILDNAENNNPELYKQHAQFIQHIIDCIVTENYVSTIQKNYTLPAEFVSSNLCKQLLPYCEHLCENNKNSDNEIIRLIALSHANTKNYHKACEYIDTLSQPLSNADLLLKARAYLETNQKLSDTDLETILKSFINNKKTFFKDQKLMLYLVAFHNDFFIQTKNHDFVIKLITKLNGQKNLKVLPRLAETSILLALYVTKRLDDTQSPDCQEWLTKLNACPEFYTNLGAPSCYNGQTNITAGMLCMQHKPILNYEKIIPYFITAIESKELLPETMDEIKKTVAGLYDEWAMATDNYNTRLALFDKALQYDNHSKLQFKKAITILNHSDDQNLVSNALQVLENIPQENDKFSHCQLALVYAYCNYSDDATRIPILKKLIPLDLNKAIACVQKQINNEQLLQTFVYICVKNADASEKQEEKDAYLNKAIEYTTILIDNNPTKIDYIARRMELHAKTYNIQAAIKDIDLMLNAQDMSNACSITKEKLLLQKIELLLPKDLDYMPYDQIIECFEQLKVYNEKNIIQFNIFPRILEHTQYLIEHSIVTDKAIEWCCLAAEACIAADNASQPTNLSAQQERDLACYILSAAKAGNLNAQLTALPYCNAITYISDTNLTEILQYSYQALFNPNNIQKRANTLMLIDALQVFTKEGVALAYYILCDYYKGHPQELEKMMLFFNEAKNQDHPEKDASDLIKKICASCKNTLLPYVERYTNSKSPSNKSTRNAKPKATLTDAIATFTLGVMYQYSDDFNIIDAGTVYLISAEEGLCNTYPQYLMPIQHFLGNAYYKLALIDEQTTNAIDYTLLRKSVNAGYIPAIHKLANIYIDQHKTGTQNIPVKATDFMSLLETDTNDQRSRELFETCKKIIVSEKKNNSPSNSTEATKELIIDYTDAAINSMITSPLAEKLVKYANHKENDKNFNTALKRLNIKNQHKEAIALLLQSSKKNVPNSCLFLALLYIQNATETKDYSKAEEMLRKALACGLIQNNTTKLFHNKLFLHNLISTIVTLTTGEHPIENRRHLLSIINNTLTEGNIDMNCFYALFKESMGIDLPSIPDWTTKNKNNNEPLSIISNARQSIVKDINNTEVPSDLLKAMYEYQNGNEAAATDHLYIAATTKKIPSACILLSCNYISGNGVKQDYDIAAEYLQKAFAYGLVEKQFCSNNFLDTVYSCILKLMSSEVPSSIKKRLLQIIKSTLTDQGINMTAFCIVVKENTNIDLLSIPEWTGKDEIKTETPRIISQARKIIVKDINDTEIPPSILKSFTATQQGDKITTAKEMYFAATTKKIPSAYTFLAWNYLLGIGVTKDYDIAEEYLQEALTYGLVEKQFCSDNFLYTLYTCMSNLISNELLPYTVKKSLLQIIKESLINHNVDMIAFCTVVKESTNIDLFSVPEWAAHSNNNNNNNQPSPVIINATQSLVKSSNDKDTSVKKAQPKLSITELKEKLVKDLKNSNISEEFKKALEAIIKKDSTKSIIFLELAEKNNDPCACITNANNYLLGKKVNKQSLYLSTHSLQQALAYGLIEKQFCNSYFLKQLCQFIQNVISASYETDIEVKFKKQLLLHIKNNLRIHEINLDDFYDIVSDVVKIHLNTCPEWIEAEKDSALTKEELQSFLNESLEKKDFTIEEFTTEISNQAKIAYTTEVMQQKNSFIKDENYKDNPDFINATNEMMQGNIKNCINYLKNIAYKDKHPQAYLILSCEYTRGKVLTKNYQEAEICLKKALEYGVLQKQICNHPFLQTLCGQIYATLTDKSFKNIKKKSLSIIKKALKEKNIDLALFEATFEQAYKIKLSTIPEWKI